MRNPFETFVLLVFTFYISNGLSQPFTKDNTFSNFTNGPNSLVLSTVIQNDQKILIGGTFLTYDGISRSRLARLNWDGSIDNSFNIGNGANNQVSTIKVQNDGKIIVGGRFTGFNGTVRSCITRLNSDGSNDNAFNVGTGFQAPTFNNPSVYTVSIQNDGKILVGGHFYQYNGVTRNHIVRLNSNGTLDATFSGTGAGGLVMASAIQSDNKILIGGSFDSYNGTTRNKIARINSTGTIDATFNPGTGANGNIWSILVQPNGKIIIAGEFTSYNGYQVNRIARLNSNGSLDLTFNSGGAGADGIIYSLVLQPDGKIVIGGSQGSYNGVIGNCLARLNSNGSIDNTFVTGTSLNISIRSLAIFGRKIMMGGSFYGSISGSNVNNLTRINGWGFPIKVYEDLNNNCLNNSEIGISGISVSVVPAGVSGITTNGELIIDSLPNGNYTAVVDISSSGWSSNCPISIPFSMSNQVPSNGDLSFGLTSQNNCASNITASGSTSICPGSSVLLSANTGAGLTYQWQKNGVNISGAIAQTYSAVTSGSYSVIVAESGGCISTSNSIIISSLSIPTVNAGSDISVCFGEIVILSGTGASVYSWNQGILNGNPFLPALGALVYTVTGTASNGCTDTDQVTVLVNPYPQINAGPDQTICPGEMVTLFISTTSLSSVSWDNGVINNVPFTPDSTSMYTVTATSSAGCASTDQVFITVLPYSASAHIIPSNDSIICQTDNYLLSTNITSASGYQWYLNGQAITGANSNSLLVDSTGSYNVLISDTTLCSNSDTVNIQVLSSPTLQLEIIGGQDTICDHAYILADGASQYIWFDGSQQTYVDVSQTGTYWVTGIGANGCQATDSISVLINNSTDTTLYVSATDQYTLNGETYYQTAIYTQILTNIVGCDSTILLDLDLGYTGLSQAKNDEFSVYPNPARDYIFVNTIQMLNEPYTVLDSSGRKVLNGQLIDTSQKLDLREIVTGLYYLKVGNKVVKVQVAK
jgi:uncharacterized delta-60 repeat protein